LQAPVVEEARQRVFVLMRSERPTLYTPTRIAQKLEARPRGVYLWLSTATRRLRVSAAWRIREDDLLAFIAHQTAPHRESANQ
jgi:hypothetical protein